MLPNSKCEAIVAEAAEHFYLFIYFGSYDRRERTIVGIRSIYIWFVERRQRDRVKERNGRGKKWTKQKSAHLLRLFIACVNGCLDSMMNASFNLYRQINRAQLHLRNCDRFIQTISIRPHSTLFSFHFIDSFWVDTQNEWNLLFFKCCARA